MAKLSISAAAKRAGIARQNLYANYINTGKITVEIDERGNKCIDTAEIIRVFGMLQPEDGDSHGDKSNRQNMTPSMSLKHDSKNEGLQVEVKLLREQLADKNDQIQEYRQREQRLLDQVDKLTDTIKQIEHKPKTGPVQKQRWWNKKLW